MPRTIGERKLSDRLACHVITRRRIDLEMTLQKRLTELSLEEAKVLAQMLDEAMPPLLIDATAEALDRGGVMMAIGYGAMRPDMAQPFPSLRSWLCCPASKGV